MYQKRAYKFRLYPNAKRQKTVEEMLVLSQRLYNKILEKSKCEYDKGNNPKINKSTLNRYMNAASEDKTFLKLYFQTRQDIFIRVMKAYQNFFRRLKEKKEGKRKKAGFPRFKSSDRYKFITYPQYNGSFSIERNHNRKGTCLRVSRIGAMKMEVHREIAGNVKTMTIKREGKHYYAVFTTQTLIQTKKMEDTTPVGIDMGLRTYSAPNGCNP